MTDWQKITTQTYDDSALELADYFGARGPRALYVELAFKLIGNKEQARVVEIGCGDGRDAAEIIKRTDDYVGFDPSLGMIELARKRLPKATFMVADALSFKYPDETDIVFAFASLLHVDIKSLGHVAERVANSLRSGGIFYVSLKEADGYEERIKEDEFGRRKFYYYSPKDILSATRNYFDPVAEIHETIGKTQWFELALRRK